MEREVICVQAARALHSAATTTRGCRRGQVKEWRVLPDLACAVCVLSHCALCRITASKGALYHVPVTVLCNAPVLVRAPRTVSSSYRFVRPYHDWLRRGGQFLLKFGAISLYYKEAYGMACTVIKARTSLYIGTVRYHLRVTYSRFLTGFSSATGG